jgi:hypothetical protein
MTSEFLFERGKKKCRKYIKNKERKKKRCKRGKEKIRVDTSGLPRRI